MTYTLAESRTRMASDFLDDADQRTWDNTALDRFLRASIAQCVSEYVGSGGERLEARASVTTDANGLYDASAISLIAVTRISEVNSNGDEVKIPPSLQGAIGTLCRVATPLVVRYTPRFVIPSDASHPLIGVGAVEAVGSWDSFCEWICIRASIAARAARSDRPPNSLLELEAATRAAVLRDREADRSVSTQSQKRVDSSRVWTWDPARQVIQLSYRVRR